MAEPFCKVDWWYEGYRQVWFYNGAGIVDVRPVCEAMRDIASASTVVELRETVGRAVRDFGLVVGQFVEGPDHADALRQHLSITLVREPSQRHFDLSSHETTR